MNTNDRYFLMKQLPSRFLAYPSGSEVRVRPFSWREGLDYAEYHERGNELDIFHLLRDRDIIHIDGFEFDDLTVGDLYFIILTLVQATFPEVRLTKSAPCSMCEEKEHRIVFKVPGTETVSERVKKAELSFDITPAEIEVRALDEVMESAESWKWPITLTMSGGETTGFDYYRVSHHIHLLQLRQEAERKVNEPEIDEVVTRIADRCKDLTFDWVNNMEYSNQDIFSEAIHMLDHGPLPKATMTCSCERKESIEVEWDWSLLSMIPFPEKEGPDRSRISFSPQNASTGRGVEDPALRGSNRPARSSDQPSAGYQGAEREEQRTGTNANASSGITLEQPQAPAQPVQAEPPAPPSRPEDQELVNQVMEWQQQQEQLRQQREQEQQAAQQINAQPQKPRKNRVVATEDLGSVKVKPGEQLPGRGPSRRIESSGMESFDARQ